MIPGFRPKEVQVRVIGDDERPAIAAPTGMVLVVDEALPVRRKLEEILVRSGVGADHLLSATSATEALSLFREARPHLVLTELVGTDPGEGLELVLEMLRLDPRVRIVLVTAEPESSLVVRQAIRNGVFAVVQKPLRHEKIRQALQDLHAEEGGIERLR